MVSNGARDIAARRRTHVAVLFVDLSGFTNLVESVDPEMVYEVVRPIMDDFVALVRAHQGEIQQVLGDGFMCVFGLRTQLGDEAIRRCAPGLRSSRRGRISLDDCRSTWASSAVRFW